MRTPRRLALLAVMFSALLAGPASAASPSASVAPWPQYQGNEGRTGVAPDGVPEPPYALAWDATADIGDPSQVAGIPAPILSDGVAIVVGRSSVDAIDVGTGEQAWTVPRAIGPSSPPALEGDLLLFLEGGGDESTASASTSATAPTTPTGATPSPGSSSSAEPSATSDASVSSLVAVDLGSQKRDWSVPLSDVSHTGVTVLGDVAVVGTDDGTVTAVDATGKEVWSQRAGDHVLAPIAASGDQVYAAVRPEARGAAALVALRASDGSQAWRYEPGSSVFDLGAPSVGQAPEGTTAVGDAVFVVGSDASLRAVVASDGSERWAAPVYSPTAGSPPAVSGDAVYVTDQSGTVYAFDRTTGEERWRFATNHAALTPPTAPIVTRSAVVQAATDGTISAIAIDSGHEIWQTTLVDSPILGAAASTELFVFAHTGAASGLAALRADPTGATEDLVSPTTADPARLLVTWLAVAVPLSIALLLLGRWLGTRMGPAPLGPTDDEPVDPWEAELQDDA